MRVELSQALDIIGNLIASLKQYASKLPAMVPLASVPGGIKPTLEAFEAGKLMGSVQPLLADLDHLDMMKRDKQLTVSPVDETRINEYRISLNKILPGNKPELEGAGRGL